MTARYRPCNLMSVGLGEPWRERPLEVRARARADERLLGLAALEDDHRREREDPVARRDIEVLVHVQLREPDPAVRFLLQPLQDRVNRAARTAPRRPEVHDHRPLGGQHLGLEGPVRDVPHYARSLRSRRRGTFQIASSTIARLIFEWPSVRSAKRIGTSTTRKPARTAR